MNSNIKNVLLFSYTEIKLMEYEGVKLQSYTDTTNNKTIGVGHKIKKHENIPKYISFQKAFSILEKDIAIANGMARSMFPFYETYPDNIRVFLTLMSFNLGYNLKKFKKANNFLQQGDYEKAREEYLDSLWAKQVHDNRAYGTTNLLLNIW